ncbi:carboxymuconolactone decarboxylase family protein [Arthrobacter crystallopoietes]|uniref:carboxymuconolactone decarboxylase family protein n=1 Tax=Crystallibacter crystallopoietes TaxID=37928 RepID=UPI003D190C65
MSASTKTQPDDTDRESVKKEYQHLVNQWDAAHQDLLELDAEFMAAHLELAAVPVRKAVLSPLVQELVQLALSANATHMYGDGTVRHIHGALAKGATAFQILEVFKLIGTLGIHAMNVGMPILDEVLRERGERTEPAGLTGKQEELKQAFIRRRGFWHEDFELLLELDPEMFEAYGEFSALAWQPGGLEPKVKEFIYIAFDVSATHLHRPGIKQHMHNALKHGATREEILAVLEIASQLGNHAILAAAPALRRAINAV